MRIKYYASLKKCIILNPHIQDLRKSEVATTATTTKCRSEVKSHFDFAMIPMRQLE